MILLALTSMLETAFNAWLTLDSATYGTATKRLQALQGKLIALEITNPAFTVYLLPTAELVRVTHQYDAPPDVTIRGSALAFMRLSQAEDAGKAILENGIKLQGDTALGTQFSQILREIDVDWEELASRAVGDIVAHHMGQVARTSQGWLSDSAHAMRLNTQEYLQEEIQVLPAQSELDTYLDAVDTLRSDVDRFEARLKKLEQ